MLLKLRGHPFKETEGVINREEGQICSKFCNNDYEVIVNGKKHYRENDALRNIGLRLDLYHSSNKEEVYKVELMLDNYADFRAYQRNPDKKAQTLVHRLRDLLHVLVDEMK